MPKSQRTLKRINPLIPLLRNLKEPFYLIKKGSFEKLQEKKDASLKL
jgi:hypothetical protein